ncbi:MAG: FecR family protein, partial [Proteobacteria bacterium]|nr:FecR family protein [Pseudomonadota bacterium]
ILTTAYSAEKIGSVEELKGIAEVFRQEGIIKLKLNDPIFEKDTLRTRANSLLKVKFNDGKIIVLTEKTKITIDSYTDKKELSTFRGGVRSIVEKLSRNESYKIKTTTAVAGIRGTDFAVLLFGDEMNVFVFDGVVNVGNSLGSIDVNKGYHTIVFSNQPPQAPVKTPDDKSKQIQQLFNTQGQIDLNKIKELEALPQDDKDGSKEKPPVISPLPTNIPPSETTPKTLEPPKRQWGEPHQPPYPGP